ncbi:hypothetical protein AgCh_036110 [Apium graveolens]
MLGRRKVIGLFSSDKGAQENVLTGFVVVLGYKFYWWINPVGVVALAFYNISNWGKTVLENAVSLVGQSGPPEGNKDNASFQRNRCVKDIRSWKLDKKVGTSNDIINLINEETFSKDDQTPEIVDNEEISINYVISGKRWNIKEIVMDDIFAYTAALDIYEEIEDHEPRSIYERSY